MSENIFQVFQNNPITTNASTDLMYFGQSPYGATNDAAMTFDNFNAQIIATGTLNALGYYATAGNKISPIASVNNGVLITGASGVPDFLPNSVTPGYIFTANSGAPPSWQPVSASGAVVSVSGTANQVLVNGTSGTPQTNVIVLTTPQNIGTASNVEFGALQLVNSGLVTSLANAPLQISSLSSATNGASIALAGYGTSTNTPIYGTYRSRSTTIGSFVALQSADQIGAWNSYGDDGTSFVRCATIATSVASGVSTGIVPSQIDFITMNTSGALVNAMNIGANQTVTVANGINFGGSTLSTYVTTTSWMPVVSFAVSGDLSVVYSLQAGEYLQIGSVLFYSLTLSFTPTYTTASGNIQITGFPVAISAFNTGGIVWTNDSHLTYPTGVTSLYINPQLSSTLATITGSGTGISTTNLTASNFTTGQAYNIYASGFYFTA